MSLTEVALTVLQSSSVAAC